MEIRPRLGGVALVEHGDLTPGLLAGLDAAVDRGALGKHSCEGVGPVDRHVRDNGIFAAVPGPAHKVVAFVGDGLVGNLGAGVNRGRTGAGAGIESEYSIAAVRNINRAELFLAWIRLHGDVIDAHEHSLQADAAVADVAHGEFALGRRVRVIKPAVKPVSAVGNRLDRQREFRIQFLAGAGEVAAAGRG